MVAQSASQSEFCRCLMLDFTLSINIRPRSNVTRINQCPTKAVKQKPATSVQKGNVRVVRVGVVPGQQACGVVRPPRRHREIGCVGGQRTRQVALCQLTYSELSL